MAAVIRMATALDGPALAAIYRPAVAETAVSFEVEPPDSSMMAARVARATANLPWIVCDTGSDVAGYAYAGPHRDRPAYQWSVEVSVYVRAEARRAGVARALYASLFSILVLQGFRNAYAGITLPNDASVGLHLSVGFTRVGVFRGVGWKLDAWHDVGWFERALAPRDRNPEPPIPLPQIARTRACREALEAGLTLLRHPVA